MTLPWADMGVTFIVPRLMVELDGQLLFADPDVIFEHYDWNIGKIAKTKLEKEAIGNVWEMQSNKKGLFLLAVKDRNGKNVEQQIVNKVRS
jgi:hypothetical protein